MYRIKVKIENTMKAHRELAMRIYGSSILPANFRKAVTEKDTKFFVDVVANTKAPRHKNGAFCFRRDAENTIKVLKTYAGDMEINAKVLRT